MPRYPVLVFAFLLLACNHHELPTDPLGMSIMVSGHVLNYYSNAPVGNAKVLIGVTEATTDANGQYSMTMAPGAYAAYVNGNGAGHVVARTNVDRVDFLTGANNCVTIFGAVRDARTHQPIAGANVEMGGSGITNAFGEYRIDWGCTTEYRGAGTVIMTATAPGYAKSETYMRREWIQAWRIDVEMQRN